MTPINKFGSEFIFKFPDSITPETFSDAFATVADQIEAIADPPIAEITTAAYDSVVWPTNRLDELSYTGPEDDGSWRVFHIEFNGLATDEQMHTALHVALSALSQLSE